MHTIAMTKIESHQQSYVFLMRGFAEQIHAFFNEKGDRVTEFVWEYGKKLLRGGIFYEEIYEFNVGLCNGTFVLFTSNCKYCV